MSGNLTAVTSTPKQVHRKPVNRKPAAKQATQPTPVDKPLQDLSVDEQPTIATYNVAEEEVGTSLGDLLDKTNVLLALSQAIDAQQKFAAYESYVQAELVKAEQEEIAVQEKANKDPANAAHHQAPIKTAQNKVAYMKHLHQNSMLRYAKAEKIIAELDAALPL